jgi:hypothetical protein
MDNELVYHHPDGACEWHDSLSHATQLSLRDLRGTATDHVNRALLPFE